MPQMWEIVGGADKGGILVREGKETSSAQLKDRLATGALVEEVQLVGERLQFKRITGSGPERGWISIRLPGKELAVRFDPDKADDADKGGAEGAGGEADLADASDVAAFIEARCAKELAKPPVQWWPVGMDVLEKAGQKGKGIFYGIEFPWDAETLKTMGPAWCTKAFHTAGTISKTTRVSKVKDIKTYIGGGACAKLTFDVEYEGGTTTGLHTKLFAKIPWPLEGKTRSDRMASSVMQQGMEVGEINASRLLESRLPFRIPRYYFGDVCNETTNFIIITERIPFGQQEGDNKIDPAYEKGRDWELQGTSEEYYYLLIREGSKMAGMYRAGKLAPLEVLDKLFENAAYRPTEHWGMRPENSGIGDSEWRAKIKMGCEFVESTAKALFPAGCTTPNFMKTYRRVLSTINAYTAETSWWCNRNSDYIAWSHGNLNVDNVFFWRTPDKELQVGVLDWGGARTDSLGWKLWWWLYGCEYEYLNEHIDGMLDCFIKGYHEHGGPLLEMEELKWQFILSAMNQGVGLLGAVPQIYRMCSKKQWPTITDRRDPRIADNIDGKNTLRIYVMTFISVCRIIADWDVPAKLDKWLDDFSSQIPIPKKTIFEG